MGSNAAIVARGDAVVDSNLQFVSLTSEFLHCGLQRGSLIMGGAATLASVHGSRGSSTEMCNADEKEEV